MRGVAYSLAERELLSSVHRVLMRHGRNRLRLPEQKTIRRYEKSRPGELVHLA